MTQVSSKLRIALGVLPVVTLLYLCYGPAGTSGIVRTVAAKPKKLAPGLYSQNGWYGRRYDVDIDGEIGHPLYVGGPTADCEPTGKWGAYMTVSSGNLPPGMSMDRTTGYISGIPTERGHWIVEVTESTVSCNSLSYEGFTQHLRFHITGSGKVIE